MKRFIFIFAVILAIAYSTQVKANTSLMNNYVAGIADYQDLEVTISFSQGAVYVSGGEGMLLEVVSLTGKKVMEQQIDSPSQKFELNIPKGCYIIKVGKVVRKVSIH